METTPLVILPIMVLFRTISSSPEATLAGDGTYEMGESVGVTSISFTGYGVSTGYDPNNSDIPLGGFIVSVGSVGGFGYQPLVELEVQ